MTVPTMEEIKDALKIPEVNEKTDKLGRVVRKNNYSQSKIINPALKKTGRNKYDRG